MTRRRRQPTGAQLRARRARPPRRAFARTSFCSADDDRVVD